MAGQHYYLLSALPALGELGSAPPLMRQDFAEAVAEAGGPVAVIRAILLSDDLMQRQAVLAGELDAGDLDLAFLTPGEAQGEAPLPAELAAEEDGERPDTPRATQDAVWAAYFAHADEVARRTGSAFLRAWVGHEVALRNALAAERAKTLGLDPNDYVIAPALTDAEAELGDAVADWSAAETPLAGLRTLDQARWEWLRQREAWFSFGDGELAVYAARLVLLHRWRRLETERKE